ncbi:beta-lactamase family protein [Flavobacterium sp. xlx-214]|uniref:serine hydrolase domain-containing protein n=1 Tax=unclassified Flavobacterium TaxID=196869 RepID=UPI0013D28785|nr:MULTISPECIES: serine hydrolase domain-containing protein [unclassified Flavobacterium]MBA5791699.1 beta-lactamase family protein [Flavobacterium sp. xlx-221]QMI82940.1 beta-lactamase family protein [Flavobacterium sp. xlx-214]
MKNIFIVLISATLLISCKTVKQIEPQNNLLTKNLELAYQKDAIKGFSVSIVNDKGVIYDKGFGFTDINQNKAYTSNTIQNIASISKTLIGVSLLKAQELGKLNLNDPINNYLPFKIINPNYPEIPILIKHLAYHTSSITDLDEIYAKSYILTKDKHDKNEGVYDYFSKPESKIELREFIQNSLTENGKWYQQNSFLNSKPGEKREYSNIAAALCALVIESATGQDYRDFTKDYILKPLKMNNSGWTSADIDPTKRTRLFAYKEKMIAEYALITYADGGFITSSNDLGIFLSELIKGYEGKGKLLTKESYEKLFEKHKFVEDGKAAYYGLFLEFRDGFLNIKNEMIGHNGSDPGVFTAMYFNPITKMGKIVLVNTDTDFTDNVWPEIEEIWKVTSDYENAIAK